MIQNKDRENKTVKQKTKEFALDLDTKVGGGNRKMRLQTIDNKEIELK